MCSVGIGAFSCVSLCVCRLRVSESLSSAGVASRVSVCVCVCVFMTWVVAGTREIAALCGRRCALWPSTVSRSSNERARHTYMK